MRKFYGSIFCLVYLFLFPHLQASDESWFSSPYFWATDKIFGGFAQKQIYKFGLPVAKDRTDLKGFNFFGESRSLLAMNYESEYLILFFHGTSGNCFTCPNRVDPLRKVSSVLLHEYSTLGDELVTNSVTLKKDAAQGWEEALSLVGGDPKKIVIFGRSLGSGVAVACLRHALEQGQVPRGMIIEAAFDSFLEALGDKYSFLPFILPNHDLNSVRNLSYLVDLKEKKSLPDLDNFKIAQIVSTEDMVVKPERQNRLGRSLKGFVVEGNYQNFEVVMGHSPAEDATQDDLAQWLETKQRAWDFVVGNAASRL